MNGRLAEKFYHTAPFSPSFKCMHIHNVELVDVGLLNLKREAKND